MSIFSQQTKPKVTITVTSGKNFLNMGVFSLAISLTQEDDGLVTVGKLLDKYKILEYIWDGPKYQNISTTTSNSKTTEKAKEKGGRKGRITGAVVGTILLPGVGTLAGAAMGTGKKSKGKTTSNTTGNLVTTEKEIEIDSSAKMRLKNVNTQEEFVIGFTCNSQIDLLLQNFQISKTFASTSDVINQKSAVELLKEYKELLDLGIITQEEFDQKKRELL